MKWIGFIWLAAFTLAEAASVEKHSFPPPPDLLRADVYAIQTVSQPQAVLVLCPGCNGNGEGLLQQPVWREFARKHRLGLIGLSFASRVELLQGGRGYYYASQGSGRALLDAVREIYGKDLPLLLYGFSGGAHFTSRFVEWKPDRVLGWCAYSAAWWDEPRKAETMPPGIVACGDEDAERYGVSITYFKQGRALGKPWLWVSLPKIGHATSGPFEKFVRDYFEAVLRHGNHSGLWVDVDEERPVDARKSGEIPALTAWLPAGALLNAWKSIHHP